MRALIVLLVVVSLFVSLSEAFIKEKLLIGGAAAGFAGAIGAAGGFIAGSQVPAMMMHYRHHPGHHGPSRRVSHLHYHENPVKVLHEPVRLVHLPFEHGWSDW